MGPGLPALLLGVALVSPARASAPSETATRFVAARVPESGDFALLLMGGRPFSSLCLDYSLFSGLAVGLAYDLADSGFSRAGGHLRFRALRLGGAELGLRLALAAVLPRGDSGFGARSVARTGDGELGVQLSYAVLDALSLFGEGAVLGETDFGRPRTAAFLELTSGVEWAFAGPFTLVGRYGLIRGTAGTARTFAAGAGVHF